MIDTYSVPLTTLVKEFNLEIIYEAADYSSEESSGAYVTDFAGMDTALWWDQTGSTVTWDFTVEQEGFYQLELQYCAVPGYNNDIIIDLLKVLGCGVESPAKYKNNGIATFNIDNLRWNKVIICTDADVDGFQIRTLILTMIYRLTPALIDEGYVYIAESPLYEINTKNKTYFAYTEAENADVLTRIQGEKFTIQRSKGLGENEAEMMWMTTMNPETRRLIKVCKADVERTREVFELLLGDNLTGRKQYIADYGADYLDQLDLS